MTMIGKKQTLIERDCPEGMPMAYHVRGIEKSKIPHALGVCGIL